MLKQIFTKVCRIFSIEGENNHEEQVEMRSNRVYFVIGMIFILFMAAMFYRADIIKGINKEADFLRDWTVRERDAATIVAGDIYDRNGTKIVEHTKVNKSGTYLDGSLYSPLIGYVKKRSVSYIDGVIEEDNEYSRLLEYYTTNKPYLFKNTDINDCKGCSLILNLDHELQTEVNRLLEQEMGTKARGSAIVMDAKTGELLACVSHPSYDANDLSNSLDKMNQAPKEDEVFYPITHKGAVVPGSIFKLITAVALIDNGMEDLTVLDDNFTIGNTQINNSYGSTGQMIHYDTGIERSSNVFYANAALKLGKDKMDETARKFMIGEELELDFGTMKSNWNIEENNMEQLALTGFGQGDTLFSTMYAAMLGQTIANDGVMMTPYLVREIQDASGNTVETGKTEVLSQVTSKETADKITKAMLAATKSHLGVVEGAENRTVYEEYEIASKTGTGENGDEKGTNNAWFVSFAPASNPQYVVVANQCKTDKYGQNLMDTVAGIYQYLFE